MIETTLLEEAGAGYCRADGHLSFSVFQPFSLFFTFRMVLDAKNAVAKATPL
jgi:hypothetical protein